MDVFFLSSLFWFVWHYLLVARCTTWKRHFSITISEYCFQYNYCTHDCLWHVSWSMDYGTIELWNTYDRLLYDSMMKCTVHIHTQCLINSNAQRTLNMCLSYDPIRSDPIRSIHLVFRLNEWAYLVSSACWCHMCDRFNGNMYNMLRCIYNWIVLTFLNADKNTIRKLFEWFMRKASKVHRSKYHVWCWIILRLIIINNNNGNKSCSLFLPPRCTHFDHCCYYY